MLKLILFFLLLGAAFICGAAVERLRQRAEHEWVLHMKSRHADFRQYRIRYY